MREAKDSFGAPQLELAGHVLTRGGAVRLRAFGSSMLPTLWPGDTLTIVGATRFAPVAGDIVLALKNQRPFIHRVEEKRNCGGRVQWITRGDAVAQSDPPVEASELLGRVALIQRNGRIIVPRMRVSAAARLLAWMLCHWDRFRGVCLRIHSFRQRWDRKARKEFANV